MLEEIRIRGLGVISDAVLEFGPGLTVVTGETGAGKTMVLSGLALLFGGRADLSRVRAGADSATVEGTLSIKPDSVQAEIVADAGGDLDLDATLHLRRTISPGGRSRAVAGGATVPATILARLGEGLLVVHGQSDQQRLTQPAEQRLTLDRYAGVDTTECRACFQAWQESIAEYDRRSSGARELQREAELLRFGLGEIARVAPQPGEDVELAALTARLGHADALRVAATTAHNGLLGDPDDPTADAADAQSLLASARRALTAVAGTDPELDGLADRLADLASSAADVGADLAAYEMQLDADPARLAATHERRAALAGLTRKYGASIDEVLAWASEAERRLAQSDTSEEAIAMLAAERDAAEDRYRRLAQEVSAQRQAAAQRLAAGVTAELDGLAMSAARVAIDVRPRAVVEGQPVVSGADGTLVGALADGIDDVEITLQSHVGAPALPVQRAASGGELSRVMLAIEVVLAGTDPVPTMVFDEVDAGVGGRAAVEVGRRLARLAREHQVIVVTHLAQVASFATRHLVVDRTDSETDEMGVTRSDIKVVEGGDRLAELARMLAGDDTEVARRHAAELLAAATQNVEPAVAKPARAKRAARSHR